MSRTKRFAVLAMVAISIVTVISGSFLYLNSQQNFFGKTQVITIGNLPLESSALLYVADKQGFFMENGLKVTFRDYDTGLASNNALLKGEVDIAAGSEDPLVKDGFSKFKCPSYFSHQQKRNSISCGTERQCNRKCL
jgi:ABC-type nitrate/sulfonate/bicarbonate transport system substrate-binding protein